VPKEQRAEMRVLAAAEVKRLPSATADEPLNALWAVLLTGGLRLSEARPYGGLTLIWTAAR
jgi:hypothetical protein